MPCPLAVVVTAEVHQWAPQTKMCAYLLAGIGKPCTAKLQLAGWHSCPRVGKLQIMYLRVSDALPNC